MVYDGERKVAQVEYEVTRQREHQVMRGFSPIIAAALFVLLMLSSACGGEEPPVAPTPAASPPATPTLAETPAPVPTKSRQPTVTVEPTQLPTAAPAAIPTATVPLQETPTPTPAPTPTPEGTATPEPTATPRPTPTALPTPTPVPIPPAAPDRARYQWDGSEILVSWHKAEGATYYKVYHGDTTFFPGPGEADLGTLKAVTGTDLGVDSTGQRGLAGMIRVRDLFARLCTFQAA